MKSALNCISTHLSISFSRVMCYQSREKRKTFLHSICAIYLPGRSTTMLKSETLTTSSQTKASRPSIQEKYGLSSHTNTTRSRAGTPTAFTDLSKPSLSRRPSIKAAIEDSPSLSRRPSISRSSHQPYYTETTNRVPRPYSISYSPFDSPSSSFNGLRSARASPARETGTSYARYTFTLLLYSG